MEGGIDRAAVVMLVMRVAGCGASFWREGVRESFSSHGGPIFVEQYRRKDLCC